MQIDGNLQFTKESYVQRQARARTGANAPEARATNLTPALTRLLVPPQLRQKGVLPWLKIAGNPLMMDGDYRDF